MGEVEGMGFTMSGGLVIGSTGMVMGELLSWFSVGGCVDWSSSCMVSIPGVSVDLS